MGNSYFLSKEPVIALTTLDLVRSYPDPAIAWIKEEHGTFSTDRHYRERGEHGYSIYDWWNFEDHIRWIIASYLLASTDGSDAENLGSLKDEALQSLLEGIQEPNRYTQEMEGKLCPHDATAAGLRIFFKDILPSLPRSTGPLGVSKVSEADASVRATRGFSDFDYETFGTYIASIIYSGLDRFVTKGAGYPDVPGGFEAWISILRRMQKSLVILQDGVATTNDVYGEGIDLLLRYFRHLWD